MPCGGEKLMNMGLGPQVPLLGEKKFKKADEPSIYIVFYPLRSIFIPTALQTAFATQLPNSQLLLLMHLVGTCPSFPCTSQKPVGHIPGCTCGKTPLAPSRKFHNPLISRCPLLPCSCSNLSETGKTEK